MDSKLKFGDVILFKAGDNWLEKSITVASIGEKGRKGALNGNGVAFAQCKKNGTSGQGGAVGATGTPGSTIVQCGKEVEKSNDVSEPF